VRDVRHRAVDSDAELRVPEIGPDSIEDGEGDMLIEEELVDCGPLARLRVRRIE
jgi:hypothetical protein